MKRFTSIVLLTGLLSLISITAAGQISRSQAKLIKNAINVAMSEPKNAKGHYESLTTGHPFIEQNELEEYCVKNGYVLYSYRASEPTDVRKDYGLVAKVEHHRNVLFEFLPVAELIPSKMKEAGVTTGDQFIDWKKSTSSASAKPNGSYEVVLSFEDASACYRTLSKYKILKEETVYDGYVRNMPVGQYDEAFKVGRKWTVIEKENEERMMAFDELGRYLGLHRGKASKDPKTLVSLLKKYPTLQDLPEEYHDAIVTMLMDNSRDFISTGNGNYQNVMNADQLDQFLDVLPESVVKDERVMERLYRFATNPNNIEQKGSRHYSLSNFNARYPDFSNLSQDLKDDIKIKEEEGFNNIVYPEQVVAYIQSFPNGQHLATVKGWYSNGSYEGLYQAQSNELSAVIEDLREYIRIRMKTTDTGKYYFIDHNNIAYYYRFSNPLEDTKKEWINGSFRDKKCLPLIQRALTAYSVLKHRGNDVRATSNANTVLSLIKIIDGIWAMDNEYTAPTVLEGMRYYSWAPHAERVKDVYETAWKEAANYSDDKLLSETSELLYNKYCSYIDKVNESVAERNRAALFNKKNSGYEVMSTRIDKNGEVVVHMQNGDNYTLKYEENIKMWQCVQGNYTKDTYPTGKTLEEAMKACVTACQAYWESK